MGVDTAFEAANDVLVVAERWMNQSRELAVITIVAGAGNAAGLVGRRMIVAANGAVFGSLGPCVSDQAAARQASAVITSGEPHLLDLPLPDGHVRLYAERLG